MGIKPSSQSENSSVNRYVGTAYDDVAIVADNIDEITLLANALESGEGIEIGRVDEIVAGDNVEVDSTNPANPVVSVPAIGGVDSIQAGGNITIDNTDTRNPIVSSNTTSGGQVDSVIAGDNITIDNTDPVNPIISSTTGSGGQVDQLVAGSNVSIDNTDPTNPIISSTDEFQGTLKSVVAGNNVTIDTTDPTAPVISSDDEYQGIVEAIVAGDNITVDSTDPNNPIISSTGGTSEGVPFLMEDATDAERYLDSVLDPLGYRWNTSSGAASVGGAQEEPLQLMVNNLDLDSKAPDFTALNGTLCDIFIGSSEAAESRAVVNTTVYGGANHYLTWDGYVSYDNTQYKLVPAELPRLPLVEGDAWVYNEVLGKFKPSPVVPATVVADFPETPEANMLYIKVVE